MKKITYVKERRENIFGTFEDIESITGDIVNQESDTETVYVIVWNRFVALPAKDIVSIE